MADFIIALMMCAGMNCEIARPEPDVSYPTYEACTAAATKGGVVEAWLRQHPPTDGRQSSIVCLSQKASIMEVEEPHDALDTELVHAEPSATSGYVGVIEKGARTLVTGRVSGTQWVRVLLKDGSTGFVFSDHLRKVSGTVVAPPLPLTPPPSVAPLQFTPLPAPAAATEQPSIQPVPVTPPTATLPPVARPALALVPDGARDCEHCPTMVAIAGGTLTMGSNDDPTEKPIHKVAIPAFALSRYELTVADWAACASAGGCSYKPPISDLDPARTPMTNLSFTDATEYVAWLRKQTGKPYRLPSEAEWEYAARAGSNTRYSWGDQVGSGRADCEGCGGAHDARQPQPVDTFVANPLGLFGMAGGVAEWVEDCRHVTYQGAPEDGSPWLMLNCMQHVLRGGSWKSGPRDVTVSSRNFYDASVRYLANGMRVALGAK